MGHYDGADLIERTHTRYLYLCICFWFLYNSDTITQQMHGRNLTRNVKGASWLILDFWLSDGHYLYNMLCYMLHSLPSDRRCLFFAATSRYSLFMLSFRSSCCEWVSQWTSDDIECIIRKEHVYFMWHDDFTRTTRGKRHRLPKVFYLPCQITGYWITRSRNKKQEREREKIKTLCVLGCCMCEGNIDTYPWIVYCRTKTSYNQFISIFFCSLLLFCFPATTLIVSSSDSVYLNGMAISSSINLKQRPAMFVFTSSLNC